jgi:hypothetical protein
MRRVRLNPGVLIVQSDKSAATSERISSRPNRGSVEHKEMALLLAVWLLGLVPVVMAYLLMAD